jgi:hypothetical protein
MTDPKTATPAAKTPVTRKAPAKRVPLEETEAFKAALALALAKATPVRESGHRAWATKDVPRAMVQFARWIAREYPDLYPDGEVDARLVMIASKAYRFFQSSDLNV